MPDPAAALGAKAQELRVLGRALHVVLAIADGTVVTGDAAQVREAFEVLGEIGPPGRLGHVVRRFLEQPPGRWRSGELAAELAFAVSLHPREATPAREL
jgi:hypothetical protein